LFDVELENPQDMPCDDWIFFLVSKYN
jgi:hypothetical protein